MVVVVEVQYEREGWRGARTDGLVIGRAQANNNEIGSQKHASPAGAGRNPRYSPKIQHIDAAAH